MKINSLSITFLAATAEKSGTVYHCIPVRAQGESIYPSDNYGTDISADVRHRLGIPMEGTPPLVFASAYITKALAFGLRGDLQERLLNGSIEGSNNEMVLACDRANLMARTRNITVYAMADRNFIPLENADRQSVSTKPVPFNETKVALRAKNADDLMREGLQILAFNENMQEIRNSGFMDKTMKELQSRGHEAIYAVMGEMVRKGKLIWENHERNINPDPVLAQKMSIDIPLHQANIRKLSDPSRKM